MGLWETWKGFTLLLQAIIIGLVALLVVLAVWWFFIHPAHLRQQKAIDKANSAYSGAQAASGKDAVGTLSTQQQAEAKRAQNTSEANNAIDQTAGAKQMVPSDTNAAGLRALCMHDNYRNTPRCRQLLGATP